MSKITTCRVLTAKELQSYRQWLSELDEEAREAGGNLNHCDDELWMTFNPRTPIGNQIYRSFSNEELLDLVISTMGRQGHKPNFNNIYIVYRSYLQLRFGELNNAKEAARMRVKQLEERKKWPPDWHTRVSTEPLLRKLEKKGKTVSDEMVDLLNQLCQEARETGLPPYISISLRNKLEKLMDHKSALECMGIPVLSNAALSRMIRYWKEEREKCKSEKA